MTGDDAAEQAAGRMLEYYRELELLVSMLVAKYGTAHEGGYRMHIHADEAFELRQRLRTSEPVVIKTYESLQDRYVIDVL